jgi:hypothetical protein
MITQEQIDALSGVSKPPVDLPMEAVMGGGDPPTEDPMAKEMRVLYKKNLPYDNLPAFVAAKNAATKAGINPALLTSSAFQEGFNKAIIRPEEVSEAYTNAKIGNDFPVDGFYNYGLDTFSDRYPEFVKKGYLPADMQYKPYKAKNEKGEDVNTAAFKSNSDALMAKAAFMRDSMDKMKEYAKGKNVDMDEDALNYFTLAAYNSGEGNAQKMFEKYVAAKDKKAWLEKGDANWQKVHKNLSPRIKNMKVAMELLEEKQETAPLSSPNQIVSQ